MQKAIPDITTASKSPRPFAASEAKLLWLSSLGSSLEFYDFVVFVFFTAVIGKLFFAPGIPDWVRQTQTFGLFAAGYLARPLGGIVMAHFGDTVGRKRMFTLSVLLMATPTLLIGLLPTYQTIGIAAPLLLLLLRILQGIAIGGEVPGASVFVAEHARRDKVGFAIGLLTGGLSFGIFLGSLMATSINLTFTQAEIAAGIWRVPFLVGGLFGLIAMWLRRWLKETPVFEEMQRRATLSQEMPLSVVFQKHRRSVIVSMISTWMLTAAVVVVMLMTPTLMPKLFGLAPGALRIPNLVATAVLCIANVAVGVATDKFGVRRVAIPSLLFLVLSTYGLYFGAAHMPSMLLTFYVFAAIGAASSVLSPLVMVFAFPAKVRFSGVSVSYNLAYAIFGGLTPLLVSWLAHLDRFGPAHYVAAVAILCLCALFIWPLADERQSS
ncbi:MFS transporter [Terriglobus saanensis]|uniref:Major facilitator superfamily MFS_1 n=1 Tax=Terriglobus saanensis (strain ATCC BAA-1853 / DSM 23119 / SP1PR4) TaxID=401053 RepID=E8UYU0_TERSS|nr:MFS transporter [Terriglobus saanensis]ADV84306.1 major facilitator superfamily MFS_1 [Terriglobus saanensis SP1PR4]